MRYLITGGAGFVGSHLAEELLHRGHEVHVVDDLSTGSIKNIEHLKAKKGFRYTIDTCTPTRSSWPSWSTLVGQGRSPGRTGSGRRGS